MGEITPPFRATPFWERPLDTLNDAEWEALCDGCGQCCLHKLEDADTGAIYETNVACTLLDCETARCTDYPNRKAKVPDCLQLTRETAGTLAWLPQTCAYRLRAAGEPLPSWHYLISGDRNAVIDAGISVAGRVISEDEAGPIEEHVMIEGFQLVPAPEEEDE
ncbi:YcgN family cysteine cluster protein [Croceicoccus naphthovorans]|uniref:Uncharacterized protein n=1 Tax=Croceicoccus naphthovorans TaxID=1348774 RepID=A0A0G3XEK6_9SPHN|nr:YcgN family cysteine cluster protein [Croceicoccus naphthovorans]AKM08818.1 hypothetical protein AB433_00530 [Croceicoccus naphthovorans]MBB3991713.1 hypothetical protein [Croceicoccus naphthovorans]